MQQDGNRLGRIRRQIEMNVDGRRVRPGAELADDFLQESCSGQRIRVSARNLKLHLGRALWNTAIDLRLIQPKNLRPTLFEPRFRVGDRLAILEH